MKIRCSLILAFAVLCAASTVMAQAPPLTLPEPSPAASVMQRAGLTDITVTYHRPSVNNRTIWGELVPYGEVWRAGANQNTVIAFSSDVTIAGQRVPAGSYGLHMIPAAAEWTVILNKDSQAWGSFFYDRAQDQLRFPVTPRDAPLQEQLAYTLDDPTDKGLTVTMRWEKRAVAFPVAVDTPAVVAASLRTQLRGLPGFTWQGFAQAASWCARHDVNLDEAQAWAERALAMNENFTTLRARALVAEKRGDASLAQDLRAKSLTVATEADMNAYGYQLLQAGKIDDAIGVFRQNVEKYPASWNAYDSLGEGLARAGKKTDAAEQYRRARSMVKDETNRKRIDTILAGLGGS
jgi:tetratricopeptide (TPR) repeat protein